MKELTLVQVYAALMVYVHARSKVLEDLDFWNLFVEMQLFFDDGQPQSFDPAMLPIFQEIAGYKPTLNEDEALKTAVAFLRQQAERFEYEGVLTDIAKFASAVEHPVLNDQVATWEGCVLKILTDGIPQGVWPPPQ